MSNAIKYVWQGQELEISPEIVRRFISTSSNVNEQEIKDFMDLCIYQHLNPFIKEAYLIKYGNERANIVTSKDVFDKRAFRDPKYDGEEVTTNYERGMNLMDLWVRTRIYQKGMTHPAADVTVYYPEYVGRKKDNTINRMWKSKPVTMLTKISRAQSKRAANPEDLARLYLTEEFDQQSRPTETDIREKDITPQSKQIDTKPKQQTEKVANPASEKQLYSINTILANKLLKTAGRERITKLIKSGIDKHKASDIIGWWLGNKDKKILGERDKREIKEQQAKVESGKAKATAKAEIVKDEPGSTINNAIPYTGEKKGLEIIDENVEIDNSDILDAIERNEKPKKAKQTTTGADFVSDISKDDMPG